MASTPPPQASDTGEHRGHVAVTSAVAAVGGMLFGYDTGVISGALLFIRRDFHTSHFMEQSIVAALLLGAAVGALISGVLADRLGRKRVVLGTAAVYLLGVLLAAFAPDEWTLIIARAVIGLAVGSSSMVVPMYIAELAPPDMRGRLVTLNQLMVTVGILTAGLIDYFLADAEAWRWMLGLAAVPSVVLLVGVLPQPESPAWLAEKGRTDQARGVLRRMREPGYDVDAEIHRILAEHERAAPNWATAIRIAGVSAVSLGVALAIVQQITGINTVIYYAPTVLEQAGLGSSAAILATVLVGAINIVLTVVSIWLIDQVGRRPLLLWGTTGMIAGLAVLGTVFTIGGTTLSTGQSYIAIAALMFYVACFAVGLGPVFWLLISEIYPLEARGQAMSVATMANWLANFLVAETFLTVIDGLGRGGAFYLYGGISVLSVFYMWRKVPETKGRSLEEISAELAPRYATTWQPRAGGTTTRHP